MSSLRGDGVRVCMIVRNPFTHDARVRREASALVADGYNVTVVAQRANGLLDREVLPDGVRVVRLPAAHQFGLRSALRARYGGSSEAIGETKPSGLRSDSRAVADVGSVSGDAWNSVSGVIRAARRVALTPMTVAKKLIADRRIAREVAALQPDVIHAHDLDALYAAVVAKRRLQARLVYDAHELEVGRSVQTPFERRWAGFRENRWIRRADAVITVSPSIADFLGERYGIQRPLVILNVPDVPAANHPVDIRQRAGIPASGRVVLYVGGILPHRGVEELVKAAELLDGYFVVLMGPSTGHTGTVEKLISRSSAKDRIVQVPPCPPNEVVSVAATADVGVVLIHDVSLSYRWSLPNKLFEYVAAGLPVVASDLPNMAAIVLGDQIGAVCDPTRPSDIANAIRRVLEDPTHLKRLRDNTKRAAEKYSWAQERETLLGLYERLTRTSDSAEELS